MLLLHELILADPTFIAAAQSGVLQQPANPTGASGGGDTSTLSGPIKIVMLEVHTCLLPSTKTVILCVQDKSYNVSKKACKFETATIPFGFKG